MSHHLSNFIRLFQGARPKATDAASVENNKREGEKQMGEYRVVADPTRLADQQVEILRQALERRAERAAQQAAEVAQQQKK